MTITNRRISLSTSIDDSSPRQPSFRNLTFMLTASKIILAVLAVSYFQVASAQLTATPDTYITLLQTHAATDGGDALLILDNMGSTGCDGVWVAAQDPGFKSVMAHVLLLKSRAKSAVYFIYNDQIWDHSAVGNLFCRLKAISEY